MDDHAVARNTGCSAGKPFVVEDAVELRGDIVVVRACATIGTEPPEILMRPDIANNGVSIGQFDCTLQHLTRLTREL
ncbi:MAG: hypothetical protein ACRCTR_10220 [Actinomycetota bacterium]